MLIRLVVLVAGAVLMTAEVLAFRIVGRTFGTAIRETTAVIAIFLAAMSVGYWMGGRIGDRHPHLATLVAPLMVAGIWLALLPGFDSTVSEAVATSSLPFATHGLVVSLVLFALPTFALAATSPIAVRLILRNVEVAGSTAGQITALSTVGSIAGTLLGGFFLLGRFPISSILRGLALLLLLTAALVTLVLLRRRRSEHGATGSTLALPLVALVALGLTSARADAPNGFGWRVIFEEDSAYHHIVVEDRGNYRRLLFDDTRQSQMYISDPTEGGFSYTNLFHTAWLFSDSIQSALFIGLGGGTGPKQFLSDHPDLRVWVAEVDPAVVRVSRRYFGLPDDDRLTVDVIDGRVALRRNPQRFDVIVVDAYSSGRYGPTLPFHLTTDEFFNLAASRLNREGVLLYNVVQQISSGRDDLIRALIKTLELTFSEVYVFETAAGGNSVVAALMTPRGLSLETAIARADSLVATGAFPRDTLPYAANLYDGRIDLGDVPVLTDDYAPVDRLLGR